MKYFYSNGNALPHIDTFTAGSHVVYVCEVKNYVFNAIRLEEQGWEIRDCIKILQEGSSKQALLLRKSFKGTVATNVLENGCGGINIDACRIGVGEYIQGGGNGKANHGGRFGAETKGERPIVQPHNKGRFPANLLISHSNDCECKGQKMVKGNGHVPKKGKANPFGGKNDVPQEESYFKEEIVADYDCVADCPILKLDLQSGITKSTGGSVGTATGFGNNFAGSRQNVKGNGGKGDIGGASRFFFSYENEEHLDIYLTNLIKVE
jgi:hypothetical protein